MIYGDYRHQRMGLVEVWSTEAGGLSTRGNWLHDCGGSDDAMMAARVFNFEIF